MEIWDSFWSIKKFNPILKNPPLISYGGTNIEPLASMGMCCFLDPSKDKFKDGFSILDYGCGAGILSNFISERLSDFEYYGLEPNSVHGTERINLGKKLFKDNRVFLGLIDNNLDFCLSKKIDSIILISVFTHLIIDDVTIILDNLIRVFKKNPNCDIVFSCFTSEISMVKDHQPHIWERFYGVSYLQESELVSYCKKNNLTLSKHTSFTAQGGYVHEIFKINKL
jgi:SAM-dependent methyltransferase